MSKVQYFLRKTVITIALIFLVITALFFLFRLMPGSYTALLANQGVTPEQIEILRQQWGLDQPLYVQYYRFMTGFITGDVGTSFRTGGSVLEMTLSRISNSFILVAPGIITAYLIGSVAGAVMGANRGTLREKYGVILVTVVGTIPEFVTSIFLIIIVAGWLDLLPTAGMLSTEMVRQLSGAPIWAKFATADFWKHYLLPYTAVVMRFVMFPSLTMRTSIVEILGQDFIYYHRITGTPRFRRMRHLMRHASLPVITLFPASMTRALGGLVLVETVFSWPGIGHLLVVSIFARDFPVVQFVFFVTAVWVIVGNYVVDLLYGVIDPRVTVES